MRPQGDNAMATNSSSIWIDYTHASARAVLWRTHMRTTTMALLCSLAACAGPVGGYGDSDRDLDGPDAGIDGGAAARPCTEIETKTMDINIASDAGFTNLPNTCWKLNGTLTVSGPGVKSLAKLGDLRSVTDLEINNTELTAIDSMSNIEVSGDIWIRYNEKLTDIAKIIPRGTVQAITVEHNAALTSLGGLAQATIVAGQTTILDNAKLTTINLGSATRLEGGLAVRDNSVATALDLKSLQSVGSITIANNNALSSVTASSLLSNIHGTLTIDNNDALKTLGQLGNSTTIDANLIITGNAQLADVGQLARANRVFGGIQITSNSALPATRAYDVGCCVMSSTGFAASSNQGTSCAGDHWCLAQRDCYSH